MATKKTLNQILRQNSFSGADVGKALILNWIEHITGQKETLSENEIATMADNLSGARQRAIYKTYYYFKQYLDDFYKLSQGNFQQYQNGKRALFSDLKSVLSQQHEYSNYLHLPLVLSEKEYNKIKADAVKDFESQKIDIYSLILYKASEFIESYNDKKDIPENIKAILDSYKNESIKIEFDSEVLTETGETLETMGIEKFREYENKLLLKAFADKYGIENSQEAISNFIANSYAPVIEESLPAEKTLKKNIDKLLNACEIFEQFKEREFYYQNEFELNETKKTVKHNKEKFIDIFEKATENSYKHIVELEEMSKIDALIELADDNLFYYNDNSRDKTTAELQQEFIKDFPELYKAVKDIISSKYKKIKTLKDSELITTEITAKEQISTGLEQPLSEQALRDYVRNYYSKLESKTTEDFIKHYKAKYGGIAVIFGESYSSFDKEMLEKFSKDPFNTLLPDDLIPQNIELYITKLIEPALYCIYGVDALLDVYSELLKVDLSKLKNNYEYEQDIYAYNNLIYLAYAGIKGTEKQIESDKLTLKGLFKPMNIEKYKPAAEKINTLKNELEQLPLNEILELKYFSQFLQGANITYGE